MPGVRPGAAHHRHERWPGSAPASLGDTGAAEERRKKLLLLLRRRRRRRRRRKKKRKHDVVPQDIIADRRHACEDWSYDRAGEAQLANGG
jgi:hypothetical protein